jgi:hypothetical protein
MMTTGYKTPLLTYPEDAPPGTTHIRHARCRTTYALDDVLAEDSELGDGAGKFVCRRCEDDQPGSGYGFHTAKRPKAFEMTGGRLFTPIAHELLRGKGPELDNIEFRVLMALASFQGDKTECWPEIPQLADAAQIKKSLTVSKALDRLAGAG